MVLSVSPFRSKAVPTVTASMHSCSSNKEADSWIVVNDEVESFNHFKPLDKALKKVKPTINCNLVKMFKRNEKKRTGDLVDKFEQMNKPKKVR